ncbi:hypothetical protein EDC96DRAFT_549962 [Choanephora cucurbitarum]|nr:hypothetical protein EDC96DRAFT_549962 [Choanephora cucurbitarum]
MVSKNTLHYCWDIAFSISMVLVSNLVNAFATFLCVKQTFFRSSALLQLQRITESSACSFQCIALYPWKARVNKPKKFFNCSSFSYSNGWATQRSCFKCRCIQLLLMKGFSQHVFLNSAIHCNTTMTTQSMNLKCFQLNNGSCHLSLEAATSLIIDSDFQC